MVKYNFISDRSNFGINFFSRFFFVTIVITYSYPLYEGFNMGKISLVTDNPRPVNVNNKDDLFNYYSNFYCDSNLQSIHHS